MTNNPISPDEDQDESKDSLDKQTQHPHDTRGEGNNPAAELIRNKIESLYAAEPDVKEEIAEIEEENTENLIKPEPVHYSKHQLFMMDLSKSGKSLAEKQTAWHSYYMSLPDKEKHEVWKEFYASSGPNPQYFHRVSQKVSSVKGLTIKYQPRRRIPNKPPGAVNPNYNSTVVVAEHVLTPPKKHQYRAKNKVREELIRKVTADGQLKVRHHLRSLGFGLGFGLLTIFIFLFSFFNEVIIAPFIQPSRNVSSTPLILSADAVSGINTPEVIIPKINVQIPVDYSLATDDEDVIEGALNSGVVHYPSTVLPGQLGNAAFFGHSSNNIFNPGKYKFAFVLLHTLVAGDTFYLVYNGTTYAYQVYATQIVSPSDVSVLNNVPGKAATATLITCDPPGTSINRLVVWGTQISPAPGGNTAPPTTTASIASPRMLPSNGPSLWDRFVNLF